MKIGMRRTQHDVASGRFAFHIADLITEPAVFNRNHHPAPLTLEPLYERLLVFPVAIADQTYRMNGH
jgi:hypothetical protein